MVRPRIQGRRMAPDIVPEGEVAPPPGIAQTFATVAGASIR